MGHRPSSLRSHIFFVCLWSRQELLCLYHLPGRTVHIKELAKKTTLLEAREKQDGPCQLELVKSHCKYIINVASFQQLMTSEDAPHCSPCPQLSPWVISR